MRELASMIDLRAFFLYHNQNVHFLDMVPMDVTDPCQRFVAYRASMPASSNGVFFRKRKSWSVPSSLHITNRDRSQHNGLFKGQTRRKKDAPSCFGVDRCTIFVEWMFPQMSPNHARNVTHRRAHFRAQTLFLIDLQPWPWAELCSIQCACA